MTSHITKDILDFAKKANQSNSSIINLLEEEEEWVIDDPDINEKIEHLLSNWKEISNDKLIKKEKVIKLLSYIATGDMIDFFTSLEKIDKEFSNSLISTVNTLNENEMPVFSMLLSRRLLVIYRLAILPRIFSEDRLKALEKEINNL